MLISIVLAAAGAVYEHFSFGVYSNFMIYAFAFPLIGGALPYLIMSLRDENRSGQNATTGAGATGSLGTEPAAEPGKSVNPAVIAAAVMRRWTYHAAIATLTVGSIMQGILAICGRPNNLVVVYPAAAAALLIAAVISAAAERSPRKQRAAAEVVELPAD